MTDKDTRKEKFGWLKSLNYFQSQQEENNVEQPTNSTETMNEEQLNNMTGSDEKDIQNDNVIFSRDNQDKIVTDLIVSLENMIKDRQLMLYTNKDIEDQLFAANETINRIKRDITTKDQLLLERDKEIHGLESKLTNKQMAYDQLLEDYKEYQNTSNAEYEAISIQLDTEINKYIKLNDELINTQHQNMLKANELEERIRNLEIENKQYKQQYEKVVEEKSELMQTINDFTDRMSFSFSSKTNTNTTDSI